MESYSRKYEYMGYTIKHSSFHQKWEVVQKSHHGEAGTVAVVATDIFTLPLVEIEKAMDDSENETYSFMDEGQKKEVKKLMQAVVSECQTVYTSTVPNFDELKENIRKLANGKHEAKEEQS